MVRHVHIDMKIVRPAIFFLLVLTYLPPVINIKNLAKEEYFKGKNPRTTPIMIEIKVFFNYKIN